MPEKVLLTSSSRFFQDDMLVQLTTRIKTLEDAGSLSDFPAHLSRITQYRFRREKDFDNYNALAMANLGQNPKHTQHLL